MSELAPAPGAGPRPRRGAARLRIAAVVAGAGGAVALAFFLGYSPPAPPNPDRPPAGRSADDEDVERAVAAVNPGYVGIEVCAECHAPRAASVKKTRHYLACRPAADGVTPAAFAAPTTLVSRHPDLRFELTRTDAGFFAHRVEVTGAGEQRDRYQIGLVYGSGGKHDEMYFAWEDDRLFHLPVAWLHPYRQWGQAAQTATALPTHSSCLECHNTWVAHVPGTINRYDRTEMHLGVTCERCHGPGRAHTDHHRANPNAPSHGILHPGMLSRDRLMDVCAQCHANAKRLGQPFAYRPGEPLDSAFFNFEPTHPEDDTTNQVRYLRQSKCYTHSEMTCTDCHNPHRPGSGAAGCARCHQPEACRERPRLPEPVRGDCVSCHMPSRIWTHAHLYTTADDNYVPLAPRAEHRIGVYPEARDAVLYSWFAGRPDPGAAARAKQLAERVTAHWTAKADEFRRAGRFKAAIGACREALRVTPDPAVRRKLQDALADQARLDDLDRALRAAKTPDEATVHLTRWLEVQPGNAFVHGELGTIYSFAGKRQQAIEHLEAVARHEPTDAYGLIRLADLAYREGRIPDALALCERAGAINPVSALNNLTWGAALLQQQRWTDAERQFRKLLRSEQTHPGGNRGLSEALLRLGQPAEAVRYARRAAHWSNRQDAEILLTLSDAYAAAGRASDARATLDLALAVAAQSRRDMVPTIRARIRELP